jgi:mRNA interferase RelE/StbE
MPARDLIVEKPVQKRLQRLPLHVHKKIIKALASIKFDPTVGIKLHGELEQYYKVRVGDYRIIYFFEAKKSTVVVVKIEHRQGVYR